jgi:Zn-dependent peptidase ImmA (M78 family)
LNGESRQSLVFLYHPRQNETHDRVFIFAHELGHALHNALTGDVNIFPDGFDSFNDMLRVKFDTHEAKQEGFADAVAIAVLGSPNSRLKSHLPTQFSKDISPVFVRYLKNLCNAT